MGIPEIVNISVNTPYPGTETWQTELRKIQTRDYRLFDIQHAVLPTRLPLLEFYMELVKTQEVLNKKHLGLAGIYSAGRIALSHLLHGQTNFVKMLWKFDSVYNPFLRLADHQQPVKYEITLPQGTNDKLNSRKLYIHEPKGRSSRAIDNSTEDFIEETRVGKSS